MLSRCYYQLTTLLSVFVGNFIVGLLPLCTIRLIGRFSADDQAPIRTKRTIVLLIYFGAGVFLSTCMLILIPESQEHFENHEPLVPNADTTAIPEAKPADEGHHDGFPIPEFIVLCGFFATFAIAEFVKFVLFYCRNKSALNETRVRFCSCAKRHTECSRTFKADNPDQTMFGLEKQKLLGSNNISNGNEFSGINRPNEQEVNVTSNLLRSSIISQPIPSYGSVTNMTEAPTDQPVLSEPVLLPADVNLAIIRNQQKQCIHTDIITNMLLLIVLALYAAIQGLSVGHIIGNATWAVILVRCLQQTIIIFVAGSVLLADSRRMRPVLCNVGTLCIMYSLGICVPMFYEREVVSIPNKVWGAVVCCICGSLLYLIFCDLLRRDAFKRVPGFQKFTSFTFGAAAVASLIYLSSVF